MKLISRSQWGARVPKNRSLLSSTRGVKVHYEGDHIDPALGGDHALCAPQVRSIQRFHMDTRGWADIAYNALVCPHGAVFVGRGPHVLCAANGPGLNADHYAVCGLVGDSGLTQPSSAMLDGIRDAIEWLRSAGNAGNEIKGHRDGYSTSCPGEPLYKWVRAGAPRPTTPKPPPSPAPTEDNEMNGQLAEGPAAITPVAVPKGRYKSIAFIADNGLQKLPAAVLRVAIDHGGGSWSLHKVAVDSAKDQPVVTFPDPAKTVGISVRREDAGDVHVAWVVA